MVSRIRRPDSGRRHRLYAVEGFHALLSVRLTFAEEKRQLTKQVAIQKAHYLELTEKIEESAKQRHDQRHHLRTLYSFLSAGETRKAMDYLETYILTTMGQERAILCSNLVIDAILQYYKNLCDRQGIAFETKMELPPDLPVSDTELSILFGNLLENAWEACCREKTNQYITVRGKYKKESCMCNWKTAAPALL